MDQIQFARFASRCPTRLVFHSFDRAATIAPAMLVIVFAAQAHATSTTNAASAICNETRCAQLPMEVAIAETPIAIGAAATPPPNAAVSPVQAGRTAIVMREPSTWGLLLGALALFIWRRRYGES